MALLLEVTMVDGTWWECDRLQSDAHLSGGCTHIRRAADTQLSIGVISPADDLPGARQGAREVPAGGHRAGRDAAN